MFPIFPVEIARYLRVQAFVFRKHFFRNCHYCHIVIFSQKQRSIFIEFHHYHLAALFHAPSGIWYRVPFVAFDCPPTAPNKALETIGVGRFIFIHKRFLVAGHRRSPMSQLGMLGIKFVHQTPAHSMTIIPEPDFGAFFSEAFLISELKSLPVWAHEHYSKYRPVRYQIQNQECFHRRWLSFFR